MGEARAGLLPMLHMVVCYSKRKHLNFSGGMKHTQGEQSLSLQLMSDVNGSFFSVMKECKTGE